jgi:hypothetical protein
MYIQLLASPLAQTRKHARLLQLLHKIRNLLDVYFTITKCRHERADRKGLQFVIFLDEPDPGSITKNLLSRDFVYATEETQDTSAEDRCSCSSILCLRFLSPLTCSVGTCHRAPSCTWAFTFSH